MANEEPIESKAQGSHYEPILPKIREWPIAKFYQNRKENLDQIVQETVERLLKKSPTADQLEKDIARAYYSETQRIKRTPWKVDKPDEKDFWDSLKKDTNNFDTGTTQAEKLEKYKEVTEIIVRRYVEEISATFDPKAYHFAKRFLSFGFATLLNALQAKNIKAIFDHRIFIQDRIKMYGEISLIRSLAKKGTVILLPTHFSNLDSIILGWAIHAIGLPAFIYGAGLNLYNSRLLGYFMNRLGANKVDRRKKTPFYLETLKSFSRVSLEKGCHSLFFPGGTRSRSGAIEKHLKLGLLGTAFEAQRNLILNHEHGEKEKIFVVPLVMSYHFVLEAKSLVRQFLKKTKTEMYYFNRKDEFDSRTKVISFIFQLLRKKSEIYLSFGKPTDLFGNEVDYDGNSLYKGNKVDIKDYYISKGEVTENEQREGVYARELGEQIVKKFLKYNMVLTSHVVAYVAYEYLAKKFKANEVYDLFEYEQEELIIPRDEFVKILKQFVNQLKELEAREKLILTYHFAWETEDIMKDGVKNVGVFHNHKALTFTKHGNLICEDLELLFYYHNRLNGYKFEPII